MPVCTEDAARTPRELCVSQPGQKRPPSAAARTNKRRSVHTLARCPGADRCSPGVPTAARISPRGSDPGRPPRKGQGPRRPPNSQCFYRVAHQTIQFLTLHLLKSLTEYKTNTFILEKQGGDHSTSPGHLPQALCWRSDVARLGGQGPSCLRVRPFLSLSGSSRKGSDSPTGPWQPRPFPCRGQGTACCSEVPGETQARTRKSILVLNRHFVSRGSSANDI